MIAPSKPLLRGVSHQVAVVAALLAGAALVAWAPTRRGQLAAVIYCGSLVTLFGISALYHRRNWEPAARAWMRRLDHSAIFVLIAGTYTPFCMLLPPGSRGHGLLVVVWIGALAGMAQATLWLRAPRGLTAVFYVALGWAVVPFWPSLHAVMEAREIALMAAGGIAYSVGAAVYALKRPDPAPSVFGYHELFHALTLVASACHFTAVVSAVHRL